MDESFFNAIGSPESKTDSDILKLLNLDTSLTSIMRHAILNASDSTDELKLFKSYFNDSIRIKIKDTVQSIFKPWDWQNELGKPIARYHQSFPSKDIPVLYTVLSDFNYGIFLFQNQKGQDALGIGKEMFIGNPVWYDPLSVSNPNFSSYINRSFSIAHLSSKIMNALATDVLPPPATNRLLDHLLYEGKKLYLVKKWLPEIQDTILHEYTSNQWKWVKGNELDIWRFLLSDKLLYKTKLKDVYDLVQPSPHSQGMPNEAPGRAVNYIGLRIIESLMTKNNISDQELVEMQDGEAILRLAKYNPR